MGSMLPYIAAPLGSVMGSRISPVIERPRRESLRAHRGCAVHLPAAALRRCVPLQGAVSRPATGAIPWRRQQLASIDHTHRIHVCYIWYHLHSFTINISQMLAYIPYMDPMGYVDDVGKNISDLFHLLSKSWKISFIYHISVWTFQTGRLPIVLTANKDIEWMMDASPMHHFLPV